MALTQTQIQDGARVYIALLGVGLTPFIAAVVTVQTAFETGYWKSGQFKDDNNASGILFVGQSNAWLSPKHHNVDSGSGTAAFASLDDWAATMVHTISSNRGHTGRPVDSTSVNTYMARLGANHYYGEQSQSSYQSGWQAAYNKLLPYYQNLATAVGNPTPYSGTDDSDDDDDGDSPQAASVAQKILTPTVVHIAELAGGVAVLGFFIIKRKHLKKWLTQKVKILR